MAGSSMSQVPRRSHSRRNAGLARPVSEERGDHQRGGGAPWWRTEATSSEATRAGEDPRRVGDMKNHGAWLPRGGWLRCRSLRLAGQTRTKQ